MSRNPQILYNSILPLGDVAMSTASAPAVAEHAVTPFTYETARYNIFSGTRIANFTWESRSSEAVSVNGAGLLIRGAFFSDLGVLTGEVAPVLGSVELRGSHDGSTWETVHVYDGLHSGANYFSFDEVSFPRYRFIINVSDPLPSQGAFPGIEVSLVNIMLGQRLEFERPIIRTHDPLPLNRTTEYQTNLSGNGQFLGRSISRRGVATSVDIPMMSREFARGPFQEFVEHAQRYPYYFSWNEALYPGDAGYVWTDEDIQTGYSGDGSLMSASWNMRGF